MTAATFVTASSWSYGFCAAAYFLFSTRVLFGFRGSARAVLLLAALVATALWAASATSLALGGRGLIVVLQDTSNALRYAIWFAFIANLLLRPSLTSPGNRMSLEIKVGLGTVLVASVVLGNGLVVKDLLGVGARGGYAVQLALAIVGLLAIEQMMRRVEAQQRWAIKPLAIALAGVFGFDLYLYADALLFGALDGDLWVARGFANVIVIPFLAVATARNSGWTVDLHISRKAVFHSTALLLSGGFLLLIAGAGYLVRYLGGDWGRALEIELLFVGALAMALVAASGRVRSHLKVFVSKHFFSYRYDYREEWLRFTRTLASASASSLRVQERAVVALANLVESPAGMLWLHAARGYVMAARWNVPAIDVVEPHEGSLVTFLLRTGWIVSIPELHSQPAHYAHLEPPAWLAAFPSPWLVVPLASGSHLLGFVVLAEPRSPIEVDWEVHDLLKAASRQAASYLGEIVATEALLEARKFDAFNRMSAFVVHDLKNLVSQLSLMLKNAERHRDKPEFQEDMLATVKHVVERMNRLMLQLRTENEPVENRTPVDISALASRVCRAKADDRLVVDCPVRGAFLAFGHEDRLEHVIGHLLQNALDASGAQDRVRVRVEADDRFALVVVEDEGTGMTPEFVRERLFRPFQTTKPTGMGIGVYESAQYLSRIGGDIEIESKPDEGTRVRVRVPRALQREEHVVGVHQA